LPALLQAAGVVPGDLAVQVQKSVEAMALYLATVRAGGFSAAEYLYPKSVIFWKMLNRRFFICRR
jgi:hypothetical protein